MAIELIEEQTRSGQVAAVTLLARGPSFAVPRLSARPNLLTLSFSLPR